MSAENEADIRAIVSACGLAAGAITSATTQHGLTFWGTTIGMLLFAFIGFAAVESTTDKDSKLISGIGAIVVVLVITMIVNSPGRTGPVDERLEDNPTYGRP